MGSALSGLFATTDNRKIVLLSSYAIVYVLCGLGAIVVWAARKNSSQLVKNLASIAFGLFIAIARAYLSGPSQS